MTDYANYEVEDFLQDSFFIDWVLNCTPEHDKFWNSWLMDHPERKSVLENARQLVSSIVINPLNVSLKDAEIEVMISSISEKLNLNANNRVVPIKSAFSKILKIAAIFLAFVLVGILIYNRKYNSVIKQNASLTKTPDDYIWINNNTVESKIVQMSDGSLSVLKPGASLKYLRSFSTKREVYLTGEGFFEVHKNPKIPFQVHSSGMTVRVLGTSFTVKSQNTGQKFEVVVNTGKVMVYKGDKTAVHNENYLDSVVLVPNQKVTYQSDESRFEKKILETPLMLSTEIAQKEFTFENTQFADVIEKINKVYDVNIEYDKTQLGKIVINASLSDRPLDEKVKLLCKAVNAKCSFADGRIIITSF